MPSKSFADRGRPSPAQMEKFVREGPGTDKQQRPGEAGGGPKARLTVEIPARLHRLYKVKCAGRGVSMAAAVQALLEEDLDR